LAPVANPAEFALAALRRHYKRVRKAVDRLRSESTAKDYHEVRSRVKRLRYAIEAFAPLCGESGEKYLRALVRVQTVLGEYQDAEVRAAHLATLAKRRNHPLPGATLLLMGRIVERDARKGRKARRRFPKVYRCMRGRPWKRLRRSLTAADDAAPPVMSHDIEVGTASRTTAQAGT
jgi:CHAD domain-containing protein